MGRRVRSDAVPAVIVGAAISHGGADVVRAPTQLVLPVDFATDGNQYAVIAAGNAHTPELPQVFMLSTIGGERQRLGRRPCATTLNELAPAGEAIAIAMLPNNNILVQSREPAQLEILSADTNSSVATISLSADSRSDTGHAIFHANSGAASRALVPRRGRRRRPRVDVRPGRVATHAVAPRNARRYGALPWNAR